MQYPEEIRITREDLDALIQAAVREAVSGVKEARNSSGRPLPELLQSMDTVTPGEAEAIRAFAREALRQGDLELDWKCQNRLLASQQARCRI